MHFKHRFEALDGLRGVAAVAVLFFHFGQVSASWICPHGGLAVDFFFVLSGFVIGSAYDQKLHDGFSVYKFIGKRIIRLYPLVIVGAVIGLLGYCRVYDSKTLAIIFFTGVMLLPTPFAPGSEGFSALPVNPPSWSLFVEFVGSSLYSVIASRLTNSVLMLIISINAVFLLAASFGYDGLNFGASWPDLWGGIPRFGFSFFMGIALYRVNAAGKFTRLCVPMGVLVCLLWILFAVPKDIPFNWLFEFSAVVFLFPFIVAAGASAKLGRTLSVWRTAGAVSYPAYVLQGGIMIHAKSLPAHLNLSPVASFAAIVGMIIVYLIGAWIVLKAYDEPLRNSLTQIQSRH